MSCVSRIMNTIQRQIMLDCSYPVKYPVLLSYAPDVTCFQVYQLLHFGGLKFDQILQAKLKHCQLPHDALKIQSNMRLWKAKSLNFVNNWIMFLTGNQPNVILLCSWICYDVSVSVLFQFRNERCECGTEPMDGELGSTFIRKARMKWTCEVKLQCNKVQDGEVIYCST